MKKPLIALLRQASRSLDRIARLGKHRFVRVVRQLEEWGYRLSVLFLNNHGHFSHLLEMDAIFLRKDCFPKLP